MKELKFNLNYLLHKRELYFVIFVSLFINLVHVFLCIGESTRVGSFYETLHTGEYQFILYNPIVTLTVLLIIVFPISFSLIFSDSNFLERKNKTINMLTPRLDYKKNIFSRLFLTLIITLFVCFLSFLFNYILLVIIYGSGNRVSYFQEAAFNLSFNSSWFLDSLRLSNPIIFTLIINLLVSFMYGLLVTFSYSISFFVKNRVVIFFAPLCLIIFSELIFPVLHLDMISFVKCLQPFSQYSLLSYFVSCVFIILLDFILLFINCRRKDVLV